MKTVLELTKRNIKLFFKDKGMFFTSLITPAILLVLYSTFLSNVYRDSFTSSIPPMFEVDSKLIDGLVGGQLISSLLAVSCITVAFCSNFLMVQDRANGTYKDLNMSPIKPSELALSYYAATLISTLLICFAATALSFIYIAIIGWYMSFTDVLLFILDVFILVLFGTALSSVVNFFLSTQGQISAVGSIVSSCYGFICGAYMPISSFGSGLRKAVSLLPGTYGTSLVRNHAMRGALEEMQNEGMPTAVIEDFKDALDCNIYCFDKQVGIGGMFAVLCATVALLIGIYVLLNVFRKPAKSS
ncbi:MAG: ABC transporter permease [Ruminococcaceae bacterium]|nr:ABC transporter permease [Oscillospiraceae bacterium]